MVLLRFRRRDDSRERVMVVDTKQEAEKLSALYTTEGWLCSIEERGRKKEE